MLDIREIEYWISRYEQEAKELEDCVTLSALYSIRDKLSGVQAAQLLPQPPIAAYSEEAAVPVREALDLYGDSDFLRAAAGKDPSAAWAVMDELMDTLRVVNPRAYESVMRKLSKI